MSLALAQVEMSERCTRREIQSEREREREEIQVWSLEEQAAHTQELPIENEQKAKTSIILRNI